MEYASRVCASIEDTCLATGLGKTKVYELIKAGMIETTTLGSRRLVLVRSVMKLLDPAAYIPAHISNPASSEPVRTPAEGNAHKQRVSAPEYGPRRTRANA